MINGAPHIPAPEPRWLHLARTYDGLAEIPGPESNDRIRRMWLELKNGGWYWTHYKSDDSLLPWCGAWCAHLMQECGIQYPDLYASARAWAEWGDPLEKCIRGCIVVFSRKGGGHVAIVDGVDDRGRLLCWGGNQSDQVSLAPFDPERVIAKRWPKGWPRQVLPLPHISSSAPSSTNES